MSIASTVLVLVLHHSHQPVPSWAKSSALGFLAKMLCMGLPDKTTCSVRPTRLVQNGHVGNAATTEPCRKKPGALIRGSDVEEKAGVRGDMCEAASPLDALVWHQEKQDQEEVVHQEWVQVARIMDRLFLIIFTVATITISVVLLGVYPLTRPDRVQPINVS